MALLRRFPRTLAESGATRVAVALDESRGFGCYDALSSRFHAAFEGQSPSSGQSHVLRQLRTASRFEAQGFAWHGSAPGNNNAGIGQPLEVMLQEYITRCGYTQAASTSHMSTGLESASREAGKSQFDKRFQQNRSATGAPAAGEKCVIS